MCTRNTYAPKAQVSGPTPEFRMQRSGVGLKDLNSNKFPGDTGAAAGRETTPQEPLAKPSDL